MITLERAERLERWLFRTAGSLIVTAGLLLGWLFLCEGIRQAAEACQIGVGFTLVGPAVNVTVAVALALLTHRNAALARGAAGAILGSIALLRAAVIASAVHLAAPMLLTHWFHLL